MVVVTYTEKSLWAGPTHKFKIREELVGGAHQIKKKIKVRQYVILFHVKHCDIVSYNLMKGIK